MLGPQLGVKVNKSNQIKVKSLIHKSLYVWRGLENNEAERTAKLEMWDQIPGSERSMQSYEWPPPGEKRRFLGRSSFLAETANC